MNSTKMTDENKITFSTAFIAPWRLTNISRMVREFSSASFGKRTVVFLIHALPISAIFVTLIALTFRFETITRVQGKVTYVYSSVTDVFNEWRTDPLNSPLFAIPCLCPLVLIFCAIFAGWLLLPNTFRGGSPLRAWLAASTAVFSCMGILLLLLACLLVGYMAQFTLLGQKENLTNVSAILCVMGSFLAFALLMRNLEKATFAAGNMQAHEAQTLRCEGCGYDLTHQPQAGLCTECGLDLRESTNADARRRGIAWQRGHSLTNWATSTIQLLFRPSAVYRTAQVQNKTQESAKFAFLHRMAIAAGACYWALCLVLNFTGDVIEHVIIPIHVAVVVSLVAWGLHRLVGAIVFTYSIARRIVRAGPASYVVFHYEAAFLWAFCIMNGSLVTSFFFNDGPWMSTLITGRPLYFFQGLPIEVWIIGGLNISLVFLWCLRIWKGFHAVRWSNF